MILVLIIILSVLLLRAAYMAVVKLIEFRGIEADADITEKTLILDQLLGWFFTTISKSLFLVGGWIIYYYREDSGFDSSDPTDYVIPIYILGFIALVARQEVSAFMVQRRNRMFRQRLRDG